MAGKTAVIPLPLLFLLQAMLANAAFLHSAPLPLRLSTPLPHARLCSACIHLSLNANIYSPCMARRASSAFITMSSRKPGVSEPEVLATFVKEAGSRLIVVDARNPDFSLEPGDKATNEKAPIGSSARARAVNVPYNRAEKTMDISMIPADWIEAGGGKESVPVITHCGGGGRGQKAKEFLEANGFKNVLNGGGPEDDECWAAFGDK